LGKVKPQPYERASFKLGMNEIIFNNFIGGVAWALGATIGLSIIITFLTLISKQVNLIPVVGSFVSQVVNFVLIHNPNLQK
jgi:hypothetical protein